MPKRVFLGAPRAGKEARCFDSAMAFARANPGDGSGIEVAHFPFASSSLPWTFNTIWLECLNNRKAHGISFFAEIQDDVCPLSNYWLQVLLEEMETTGADIVSAICPIKDARGLTSTAIDTDDPFLVRRLTMTEVMERPETWTEPGLLVNTGLWLVRLDTWCEELCFKQIHRTLRTDDGKLLQQMMTEDWLFSREAAALGAKIYATRKVALYHESQHWHNQSAWGAWKRDENYYEHMTAVAQMNGRKLEAAAV